MALAGGERGAEDEARAGVRGQNSQESTKEKKHLSRSKTKEER